MSCEVADSPFSDPGFANPFDDENTYEEKLNFAPLEKFNSSFGTIDQGCINPQALSNTGSPSGTQDATLTPNCVPNIYPSDFHAAPASPYFQSVEQPYGGHVPPHLQNQHLHRRSVSEPPDGAFMHHQIPQQDGPVTFHRGGHTLGTSPHSRPPIKRVKQTRAQPYHRSPRKQATTQDRYHLRHNPIQPAHLPPTSVPRGLPVQHSPQPQHFHPMPLEHMPPQPHYVHSRVCTPAPEAIDPFLGGSPAPAVALMGNSSLPHGVGVQAPIRNDMHVDRSVTIKMGVDELRALMTEVVQKAVEGLQTVSPITSGGAVVGETSVKASVEGTESEGSSVEVITVADDIFADDKVAAFDPGNGLSDSQAAEETKE